MNQQPSNHKSGTLSLSYPCPSDRGQEKAKQKDKQMDGQTDMKDGRQSNELIGRDMGGGGEVLGGQSQINKTGQQVGIKPSAGTRRQKWMELRRSQVTGLLTDGFFDHLSGTVGENTVCPFTGVHVNGTQQLVQKHSSHIQIRQLPIT